MPDKGQSQKDCNRDTKNKSSYIGPALCFFVINIHS